MTTVQPSFKFLKSEFHVYSTTFFKKKKKTEDEEEEEEKRATATEPAIAATVATTTCITTWRRLKILLPVFLLSWAPSALVYWTMILGFWQRTRMEINLERYWCQSHHDKRLMNIILSSFSHFLFLSLHLVLSSFPLLPTLDIVQIDG